MRTRLIDENNDFTFGLQQSGYCKGAKSVELDIKTALQEFYSDCFFNMTAGIPWLERLGDKEQQKILDDEIYNIASNRYGVLDINNFKSYVENRQYYCNFNVIQIFSNEILDITFNFNI